MKVLLVLRSDFVRALARASPLSFLQAKADIASPYDAGMDARFGPHAYGHAGRTGSRFWIDPRAKTFLIILSSRLHPDGRGDAMPLRKQVAEPSAMNCAAAAAMHTT